MSLLYFHKAYYVYHICLFVLKSILCFLLLWSELHRGWHVGHIFTCVQPMGGISRKCRQGRRKIPESLFLNLSLSPSFSLLSALSSVSIGGCILSVVPAPQVSSLCLPDSDNTNSFSLSLSISSSESNSLQLLISSAGSVTSSNNSLTCSPYESPSNKLLGTDSIFLACPWWMHCARAVHICLEMLIIF